jgi:ABC-type branched-subunit amino acid transport system substrate-binding protein
MLLRLIGISVLNLWVALWLPCQVQAEETIKLGMSAPFSGPAAQLGQQFSQGANLVFAAQNAQGGIAGKSIQLITADDGYEPLRAVENTRNFILKHQVFALFGYVGTPTFNAILPLLRKHQLPYLTPFSGADILRQTEDAFIFNFRASYREEAAAQVRNLVDQKQYRRIALLIQADEFGASVEQWFKAELANRQLEPVITVRFQRNSADMQAAVTQLKQAEPDAVFTVGTYMPLARAIHLGQQQNFNPIYSVVSFTGIRQLQQLLKPPYQVFATMVVPDPADLSSELARAYRNALNGQNAEASEIGMEGFAAATLLVSALKKCTADLNQSCLMRQLPLQHLFDFPLIYLPEAHQASQQVFLYQISPQQLQKI